MIPRKAAGTMYTTKIPAHAVTQGMVLADFGIAAWPVRTTEWVSDPITHKYTGTFINGVPFLYNEPLAIVVGAATKAR